ncbi:MAG: carboxypeptidase regulatory-like domain-containing protein [Planctomycetota bacterium]|nr:carboxypeptidase regulatory-like domain-containing protein [Planctomycetota bacterium]
MLRATLLLAALALSACAATSSPSDPSAIPGTGFVGRVVLHGPAPERARHGLEPALAAITGSDEYVDELWLVDGEGGVQNAVVLLEPLGDTPAPPLEPAQTALFEKVGAWYEPRVLVIPAGTTVTLSNRNSICNGFVARARRNEGFNTTLSIGMERTSKFDAPEAVHVICDARPYMRGAIVAVDTPHHRLTGADGRFAFQDLAPGRYRLRVWHEAGGWVKGLGEVLVVGGEQLRREVSLAAPGD